MRSQFVLGVAALLTTTLVVAGCGSSEESSDPAKELTEAATKTVETDFAISYSERTSGNSGEGQYDEGTGYVEMRVSNSAGTYTTVTTDATMYLDDDQEALIYRYDFSLMEAGTTYTLEIDPIIPFTLVAAATDIQETEDRTFTGTVDLATIEAADKNTALFLACAVAGAEGGSTETSFTATLDEDGYLSRFAAAFPGGSEGQGYDYAITYSDFETPVTVNAPSGPEVVNVEADMY